MAKNQPVPCIIREGGSAEEDSLVENTMRMPLHPLDQCRAFRTLRDGGTSEEEITARFFAPVSTIKQRLRLASVSDSLLDIYGEDGMTLDQLMAFSVSTDHARQEHVWTNSGLGQHMQPHAIRRMLTEDSVDVHDRRAVFVGVAAYEAAGGYIMRDTVRIAAVPSILSGAHLKGCRVKCERRDELTHGCFNLGKAWQTRRECRRALHR